MRPSALTDAHRTWCPVYWFQSLLQTSGSVSFHCSPSAGLIRRSLGVGGGNDVRHGSSVLTFSFSLPPPARPGLWTLWDFCSGPENSSGTASTSLASVLLGGGGAAGREGAALSAAVRSHPGSAVSFPAGSPPNSRAHPEQDSPAEPHVKGQPQTHGKHVFCKALKLQGVCCVAKAHRHTSHETITMVG